MQKLEKNIAINDKWQLTLAVCVLCATLTKHSMCLNRNAQQLYLNAAWPCQKLTLWRPLLPYWYSYKASYARPG